MNKLIRLMSRSYYDLYVDSVNGNDNYNGKYSTHAFATIAQLLTVWQVGQSVGLARGSSWREQMTIPGNDCKICSYGSGNLPLLDGSDVITSGAWSKTAGQTNIYEVTLSDMPVAATNLIGLNPFENDVQMFYYSSLANLDAAGSLPGYFVANPGTATPTLYINASGADKNPVTNGKTYEYTKRPAAITYSNENILPVGTYIKGVHGRRGYQVGGTIRVGPQSWVINCTITQANKYGIFFRDGCVISGCTITDGHHPTEVGIYQLLYNQTSPAGLGIQVNNNTCQLSSTAIPRASEISGLTGHTNTGGTFGAMSVSYNVFADLASPISDMRGLASLTLRGNTYTNCLYGIGAPSAVGQGTTVMPIDIFDDVWTSNVINQRMGGTGPLATITWTHCTFTATARPSGGYFYNVAAGKMTLIDCTITFTSSSGAPLIYCSSNGVDLTVLRNVITTMLETNYYRFTAGANGMTWVSDYNTFDYVTHFRMNIFDTVYDGVTAFADYKAATSQDANSTAS